MPELIPTDAGSTAPAGMGEWIRAVWLESDRTEFASLTVFWQWYQVMSALQASGFVLRRGGVQ